LPSADARVPERHSPRQQHAEHDEQVLDVELAEQRRLARRRAVRAFDREPTPPSPSVRSPSLAS
jgi:hypothetical protein